MSKLNIILGGWLALNAVVAIKLLTRRSRPHMQHRLFRWVIGDRQRERAVWRMPSSWRTDITTRSVPRIR